LLLALDCTVHTQGNNDDYDDDDDASSSSSSTGSSNDCTNIILIHIIAVVFPFVFLCVSVVLCETSTECRIEGRQC